MIETKETRYGIGEKVFYFMVGAGIGFGEITEVRIRVDRREYEIDGKIHPHDSCHKDIDGITEAVRMACSHVRRQWEENNPSKVRP